MRINATPVKRAGRTILRIVRDRRGASALEYGLIIAAVALTMLVGLSSLGNVNTRIWNSVDTKVATAQ